MKTMWRLLGINVLVLGLAVQAQTPQEPLIIRVWGSPQMQPLLLQWEGNFQYEHPEVRFNNELKSTVTAVAGVYCGRAELGMLGREIWPTEAEAFRSVEGHAPVVVPVAGGSFDVPKATFALMVFVSKDNPVTSLSLEQLRAAFGEGSGVKTARVWGDLGATGKWARHPVHRYSFETGNDKALIFRDRVFAKNDLWAGDLHQFGNTASADAGQEILDALAEDPDGIAISNVHYANPRVKMLELRVEGAAVSATRETVAAQRYPLSREVYIVLDGATVTGQAREFLRYIESDAGQAAVMREGEYLPLPESDQALARAMLGKPR